VEGQSDADRDEDEVMDSEKFDGADTGSFQAVTDLAALFAGLDAVEDVKKRSEQWVDSTGERVVKRSRHEAVVEVSDPAADGFQGMLTYARDEYDVTDKRVGVFVYGPDGEAKKVSWQSEDCDGTVTRYKLVL